MRQTNVSHKILWTRYNEKLKFDLKRHSEGLRETKALSYQGWHRSDDS